MAATTRARFTVRDLADLADQPDIDTLPTVCERCATPPDDQDGIPCPSGDPHRNLPARFAVIDTATGDGYGTYVHAGHANVNAAAANGDHICEMSHWRDWFTECPACTETLTRLVGALERLGRTESTHISDGTLTIDAGDRQVTIAAPGDRHGSTTATVTADGVEIDADAIDLDDAHAAASVVFLLLEAEHDTAPSEADDTAAPEPFADTVTIPAVWVGLLRHGLFTERPNGVYTDAVGRPVTPAGDDVETGTPRCVTNDLRELTHEHNGATVTVALRSNRRNYWLEASVATPDGRVVHADDADIADGRIAFEGDVTLTVRIEWPTANARTVAIDTIRRVSGLSKRQAATVADEGRFAFAPDHGDVTADIVGDVAAGWLTTTTVHAAAGALGLATTVDGDLLAVADDGRTPMVVSQHDWSHATVGGSQAVDTGLPPSGGPNPMTAAKRLRSAAATVE